MNTKSNNIRRFTHISGRFYDNVDYIECIGEEAWLVNRDKLRIKAEHYTLKICLEYVESKIFKEIPLARYFRRIGGFTVDTDYVEYSDGKVFAILKNGIRKDVSGSYSLEYCLDFVSNGLWVEIEKPVAVRRFTHVNGFLYSDVGYIEINGDKTTVFLKNGEISKNHPNYTLNQCLKYVEQGDWKEITDMPIPIPLTPFPTHKFNVGDKVYVFSDKKITQHIIARIELNRGQDKAKYFFLDNQLHYPYSEYQFAPTYEQAVEKANDIKKAIKK